MENLDGMQDELAELRLDVEWERAGMLSVATEPHQVGWLQEAADAGEGAFLDGDRVQDEVHSPTYLAGLFDADGCAIVNPAKLAIELSRACQRAGVQIYEHTNATSIRSAGVALTVDTGDAGVTARQAVLATNVFSNLLRRNRWHTVPVYDYVLATEPLSDAQLDRIGWRNRQGIGDCANQFHYYRLSADNRIVWGGYDAIYRFGGRVDAAYEDRPETYRRLAAHFFLTFPQLDDVTFQSPVGRRDRHQHPFLRALGARKGRQGGVRQRLHRIGRRRSQVCRRRVPRSARRCSDAANRARDGPSASAAVPS